VRTRFQLIVLAGIAVEENDLLRVSAFRHRGLPLAISLSLAIVSQYNPFGRERRNLPMRGCALEDNRE
jgi:hypothetical protein